MLSPTAHPPHPARRTMKAKHAGRRYLLEHLEPRRLLSASGLLDLATAFPQSQDTGNCCAAVVKNQAIFAGFDNGYSFDGELGSTAVAIYNAATGNWSSASLSTPRHNISAVTVGNDVLFAGGNQGFFYQNGPFYSDAVDIYNSASGNWSARTLSASRTTGVAYGNVAILAGDAATPQTGFDTVDMFNSTTGNWTVSQLPESLASGNITAVAVGDEAVFIQSNAPFQSAITNAVDIYNFDTHIWTTGSLSQARADFSTTVVGDKLFIAGGRAFGNGADVESNVVDVYNAASGQWSTLQLPHTSLSHTAVSTPSQAIFVYDAGLDIFDTTTGQWTNVSLPNLGDLQTATIQGNDVVLEETENSGQQGFGDAALTTLIFYNLETAQTTAIPLTTARDNPAPLLSIDNQLICAGGWAGEGGDGAAGLGAVDIVSATSLSAPSSPNPASGAIVTAPPPTLRWSPTPGATKYQVYADGATVPATVRSTHWSNDGALGGGDHTWQVVAVTPSGRIAGPLWNLSVAQPDGLVANSTSPLSQARDYWTAISVNGQALIAGGDNPDPYSGDGSNVVDIYNQRHHRWTPATLSQAVGSPAAISVDGLAIFAGGNSTAVSIYNTATGLWSTANLSVARYYGITAVSVGDDAIFAGGYLVDGGPSNAVDIYNAKTNQWSTATLAGGDYPLAVTTTVGDMAIFTSQYLRTANIYDAKTGTWSVAALPDWQIEASAVVGDLAIFPCVDGRADVYDSATGAWSLHKLPSSDQVLSSAVVGTKAIFPCYDGTEYIFDALTGRWSSAKLPETANGFSTSVLGSKAILTSNDGLEGDDQFSDRMAVGDLSNVFDPAADQIYTSRLPGNPAVTMGNQLLLISGAADSSQVQILTDTTPSPVLGGSVETNSNQVANVTLFNSGDAALKKGFRVNIYASTTARLHPHSILLGSFKIHQSLAAGESLPLQIPLNVPRHTPAGSYRLFAAVSAAGQITPFAAGQDNLN